MQIIKGKKKIRGVIYLLLCLLTVFVCWLFVGRNGVFGAKVDWISQHSVIPDYFRQQFYDTGELFPEFAANLGGGQNIYNFSYYGLYSPVILLSYLLPFVKMERLYNRSQHCRDRGICVPSVLLAWQTRISGRDKTWRSTDVYAGRSCDLSVLSSGDVCQLYAVPLYVTDRGGSVFR